MPAEQLSGIECAHGFAGGIAQFGEQIDHQRKSHRRHDGAHPQTPSEHHHRDEHQRNLDHQPQGADGHRGENGMNHNAGTESPARHDAVRVDEIDQSHRRHETPEENKRDGAKRGRLRGLTQ